METLINEVELNQEVFLANLVQEAESLLHGKKWLMQLIQLGRESQPTDVRRLQLAKQISGIFEKALPAESSLPSLPITQVKPLHYI